MTDIRSEVQSTLPQEKRIFLSFASEDERWVNAFTARDRFPRDPDIKIINYRDGETLDFGPLGPWLNKQVEQAGVLIAFVSSSYCKKNATCGKEWRLGLTAYQKGRLIFVPVIMEWEARRWWAEQRTSGRLSELPLDYQYMYFAGDNGERLPLPKEGCSPADDRIRKLALKVQEYLDKPLPVDDLSSGRESAVEAVPDVVVLGHPTNRLAEDVEQQTKELCINLSLEGLHGYRWANGWRTSPAARTSLVPADNKDRIFVQPLAPGDAADYSTDADRTGAQLKAVGTPSARVTLWLPYGQHDDEFERVAAAANTDGFPALKHLSPKALAVWLRSLLQPAATDLVLQIETVGYPQGTKPDRDDTAALADQIQERFQGVVGDIIIPEPSSWEFYGDLLKEQFVTFQGERAIVAVHDLNIPRSNDPAESRKALEKKFQFIEDAINAALSEKPRKLDIFPTALVVKNTEAMPFAKYPSPKWKKWRLLRFESPTAPGTKPDPKPDPNSLAVFRKELHQWATS
jgi:hypothetical protein